MKINSVRLRLWFDNCCAANLMDTYSGRVKVRAKNKGFNDFEVVMNESYTSQLSRMKGFPVASFY